jgi:hypothetical protein
VIGEDDGLLRGQPPDQRLSSPIRTACALTILQILIGRLRLLRHDRRSSQRPHSRSPRYAHDLVNSYHRTCRVPGGARARATAASGGARGTTASCRTCHCSLSPLRLRSAKGASRAAESMRSPPPSVCP